MSKPPYVTIVVDCCGPVKDFHYATFEELKADLPRVQAGMDRHRQVLDFANLSECDVDSNGLTAEQLEEIDSAGFYEGRR